jgi:DNA repair exonuclease SbcCD ATPase subunit
LELQEKIAVLNVKYDDKCRDIVQQNKENKRLKNSLQLAEERVKSALHDQMTLHNQIQGLEDEIGTSKASITKLSRELEDQKNSKGFKEAADKQIADLQKHIQSLIIDVEEAKAGSSVVTKLQSDLLVAESLIQTLENKVDSYVVELEKGAVAIEQLDSLREQLRAKTKENRDMALMIHGLEGQLRDVPYLHNRVNELTDELNESKLKTDKIPGLLSEIARLRGSSRASVKALVEQDKSLAHMKEKLKLTEADNMQLKKDNRTMQELENKLKETTAENKRLLSIAAEVSSLKVGIKQQEEEKKTIIDQNKKIKNMMRKASIIGTAFQPANSSIGVLSNTASSSSASNPLGVSSNLNESLNTAMALAQGQQQQSYPNITLSGTSDSAGISSTSSRNPTPERVF